MSNSKDNSQDNCPPNVTLLLVLTTFFWGGSFVFSKIGLRDIPPVTFFFLRFSVATLLMGLVCLPRLKRLDRDILRKGVIVGSGLAATNLAFIIGVSGTSISRAGFLNNLFVLIIPLLSLLFWRERLDRPTIGGLVLAMAGLWALASGGVEGFNRGDLVSVVCAFFIALQIISVSRVLGDEDIYLVSLVQFATVALVGGILQLVVPAQPFAVTPAAAGSVLYCAVFPTVVCFTMQNTYQRYTTPTKAGLIYTLDPVWSVLGGMFLLGERLTGREWLGCVLTFAAVLVPLAVKRMQERQVEEYVGEVAD